MRRSHQTVSTRRNILAGLGSIVAAAAVPRIARAAIRTIRIGHNSTDASPFGQGTAAFAAAVADEPALAGALKIEVYGNAQLGDDMSMLKSCIAGTLDGALVGASAISNFAPELGLLNAPYLFRDIVHARSVLDSATGSEFMQLARAKGLPVLAWGENGLRHVTANIAVRKPADLQGLKIRVPQSEVMLGGFRALGAVASPLPIKLLRDALASGEFQAQENAITIIEAAKLYDFQKYCCLTGHIIDPLGFILSTDLLDDLTEAQRIALAAAARKGAAVTRQVSDNAARDGIGRLRAAGMTIIDNVDVAAFRTASRPYLEGLAAKFGTDRVQSLLNAVA